MFSRKHLAAAAAAAGLVVAGAAIADAGDKAQGQGCEGSQASRGGHGQGHERMGEMRERMGEMHARMGAMHGRHGADAPGQPKDKAEEHRH